MSIYTVYLKREEILEVEATDPLAAARKAVAGSMEGDPDSIDVYDEDDTYYQFDPIDVLRKGYSEAVEIGMPRYEEVGD